MSAPVTKAEEEARALLIDFLKELSESDNDNELLEGFASKAAKWSIVQTGLIAKRAMAVDDDALALKALEKLMVAWERIRKQIPVEAGSEHEAKRNRVSSTLQQAAAGVAENL